MSDWLVVPALDRCQGLRADPGWVRSLWTDPAALAIGVGEAMVAVTGDGSLATEATTGAYNPELHHLLGLVDGSPWFATTTKDDSQLTALRSVMDDLPAAELQVAFTAVGLAGWHAGAKFCPRCGATTKVVAGGMARRCTSCGRELYPRTDPAIIVAILDSEDRLLLGRQQSWAPGRYSVFAGFVEMGESLEQAVHREMAEEVGLRLTGVTYLGSQPWPFPRSLMVGFVARAERAMFTRADGEIEAARWFSVDQLRTATSAGEVTLPPFTSISRRMIESWIAGRLQPAPLG